MPDMLVKLYDLPPLFPCLETLEIKGFRVQTAKAYEKYLVLDWVNRLFGSAWASECDVTFNHQPITCFLATQNASIIGFACYESAWKNFFGPIGVAESARHKGIGTGLLLASLHAMAAQGYAYAIIGSTSDPTLYVKAVGATPIEGSEPGMYRDRLSGSTMENQCSNARLNR